MERKNEITEKQLIFLEEFLSKKYPNISDETRIELIDHLVSDFETTSENENLSQYLSNELEFTKKFVLNKVKIIESNYTKNVWQEYFSFFTTIKRIPITAFVFFIIYVLSKNMNDTFVILTFFISVFGIYGYSLYLPTKNLSKKLRKTPQVQTLGKGITMGIPYIMSLVVIFSEIKIILLESKVFFSLYWFFAFSLGVSVIIVTQKEKKLLRTTISIY